MPDLSVPLPAPLPGPGAAPDAPLGDISAAKADALSSLKQSMPGYTPLADGARQTQVTGGGGGSMEVMPNSAPDPTADQIKGAGAQIPGIPAAPPPPKQAVTDAAPEDNTHYGMSSFLHFIRDATVGPTAEARQQSEREIKDAVPRGALQLWKLFNSAAAGGIFLGEKAFGSKQHYEDAQFNYIKNHIQPAIDNWTPKRGMTGDQNAAAPVASAVGGALEFAPSMVMGGGAGTALSTLQAIAGGNTSAQDDIDADKNVTQSIADGTIDTVATMLMAKGFSPSKFMLRRVIRGAKVGALVQLGSNIAKVIVGHTFGGNKNAPTAQDFLKDIPESAILGGLFGVKRHAAEHSEGKAKPGSERVESTEGAGAPPPSPAAVAAASADTASSVNPPGEVKLPGEPAGVIPGPKSAVPDQPSPEPLKDIKAQFKDMNDKSTPRTGVLVTPETGKHLESLGDKTLAQAKAQGRTVDFPQGTLVLKTKGDVIKVKQRMKAGEDPQAIIGSVTGAGSGKSPDATAVVQGRDATGAVASETTVHPNDVPLAVAKMQDQGKTPVVTTPEEAVARRVAERSQEAAQPAPAEPVAKTEAMPEHESDETPAAPAPRMGLFKPEKGDEVAVHIEDGAPPGKVRVRPIDASTGEASDRTIDVPAERVRQSQPPAPEQATATLNREEAAKPVSEVPPEKLATAPGEQPKVTDTSGRDSRAHEHSVRRRKVVARAHVQDKAVAAAHHVAVHSVEAGLVQEQNQDDAYTKALRDALAFHMEQEQVQPGYAHAGKLSERQDNAVAFAKVLRTAAKAKQGKMDDRIVNRANKAAAATIKQLGRKSAEQTQAGQGTSHTRVDALNDEMHRSARELLGTATEADKEPAMEPKAAELNRRITREKTGVAGSARKPAKEVRVAKKTGMPPAEKLRTQKLVNDYIASDFDEHPKAHQALLQHLHELADKYDDFPRDQIDQYMRFLSEQRDEQQGEHTGRMSDTIEPESHEFEQPEEGFSRTSRPLIDEAPGGKVRTKIARNRLKEEWKALGDALLNNHFFAHMDKFRDTGEPLGTHFLLQHFIEHATQSPTVKAILSAVRARVPDAPVYNRSALVNPKIGDTTRVPSGAVGIASFAHNVPSVQINFDSNRWKPAFLARALVHEAIHTGTVNELAANPNGELATRMKALHNILLRRLEKQYGAEAIRQHISYWDGGGPKPATYNRALYGAHNPLEMMSEVLSNPDFVDEINATEKFASPDENFDGTKQTLLTRIFKAIGHFFGHKEAPLLQHILDTTYDVMDAQNAHRPDLAAMRHTDIHEKLPSNTRAALGLTPMENIALDHVARMLDEDPEPLRGNDREMAELSAGSGMHTTAKEFAHTVKSGVIDGLRKSITALKTVNQIYRDHIRDFGHDTSSNPLRRLQDADSKKETIIHHLREISDPVARKWARLSREDDLAVSKLMIDTTMYKLDPRLKIDEQSLVARSAKGAEARLAEFKTRYDKLSPEAREVYDGATDANRKLVRAQRRAGVDTAIDALEADLSPAQRGLLYGAKNPAAYDAIIGKGKLIDLGDEGKNEKLKSSLRDFAGFTELDGPYHHLGRQGDFVVAATPEGTREFDDRPAAEEFAQRVSGLSPRSRAKVVERGGKFAVDYRAEYVSMHRTQREAERVRDQMEAAGLEVGHVTRKTMGTAYGALTHGMQELVTEATRKMTKGVKSDEEQEDVKAQVNSLRSAFLQIQAARSAFAGSRLARRNIGGVKPLDMRQNFAEHALSAAWHTAQMSTVFDHADAMAKLRSMARDRLDENASQATMYRRGEAVKALADHTVDDVNTMGQKAPMNAMLAKLGFMGYLASTSHAAIWLTQNFTTAIPTAGPRWGYGKSLAAFGRAMAAVASPVVRAHMQEVLSKGGDSESVHQALLAAIAKHPTLGHWAQGDNSPLRQLFDRGVISHGYADELTNMAKGPSVLGRAIHGYDRTIDRIFSWARVLPAMASSFNRLSTALAALELTGGDIRKTSDFVDETHADYSQANKPLLFKKFGHIPGGNSITMFKTYTQAMIHLLYGNLKASFVGDNKAEAAKTFAGLVIGNALFAGAASAIGLEPLRLALYAYHKIADKDGDVWDFRNAVNRFLVEHFGKTVGNALATGPIPRALNIDVSKRMGLSDLFFHDPPDLLSGGQDAWKNFFWDELGPMPQLLAKNVSSFSGKFQRGDLGGAFGSIVPVKQWQDARQALDLLQAGDTNSSGASLTQPSGADAVTRFLGFTPTDVGDEREKTRVKIEYADAAKAARTDILKQITSARTAGEQAAAYGRMDRWNRNNPTMAIGARDIERQYKYRAYDQAGVERNAKAQAATSY
ncbi:MAG TPA: PLxRFG domain-containing protein [Acidobacteriaceae bacterium]|nr:PLxRFG domain-containing protein [Acidobacteriaceae bacterium]